MQKCIEQCQKCQEFCLDTINQCLKRGGPHADPDHIRMLMACAEICDTCARFMLLGSSLYAKVCEVCADVCDACSKECGRLQDTVCADTCRRCTEICRQTAMAKA
jgi:hypothetical protein